MAEKEKVRKLRDTSGLDPESFHVPVSDSKGHNQQVVFRCMPNLVEAMNIMVQSRKFPYNTISECIRHSIVRHLGWLEGFGNGVPSVTGQIRAINQIIHEEERNIEFKGVLDKLREQVGCLRRDGDDERIPQYVHAVLAAIKAMPEGYWKRKYLSIVNKDFGDVLGSAQKVDWTESEDNEEEDQ